MFDRPHSIIGRDLMRLMHVVGASLSEAHVVGASLSEAHVVGASLSEAHVVGASMKKRPTLLRRA